MAIITNILWISNERNEKVNNFINELQSSKLYNITLFNSIEESINKIKNIRFEETLIIITGILYIKFLNYFKKI